VLTYILLVGWSFRIIKGDSRREMGKFLLDELLELVSALQKSGFGFFGASLPFWLQREI
jgi:hypothetical protein